MANDLAALMDHLGHERASIAGHDRGARVGTRFAKDHPERIDRFVALDNIPTRVLMEKASPGLLKVGWFFLFLAVPDLPEALIAGREEAWLTYFYRSWPYNPEMLSPEEIDVYVRAYRQPGAVRGAAMDYRAVEEDVMQDMADADQRITCPGLVLWGDDFAGNQLLDLMDAWTGMADDVSGHGLPSAGICARKSARTSLTRSSWTFSRTGTADPSQRAGRVSWDVPGQSRISGANPGVGGILDVLSALDSAGVTVTVDGLAVGNDSVTAWMRERGKRADAELDVHVALVITLRDDKVAALTGHSPTSPLTTPSWPEGSQPLGGRRCRLPVLLPDGPEPGSSERSRRSLRAPPFV